MHYTLEATLGQLLENPVGADLVHTLLRESGMRKREYLLLNPLVKRMPLKRLQKLIGNLIDGDTLQVICDKMNTYSKEKLPADERHITKKWWKEGICYQIYPRSFMDSNGDGIGDIQGIICKLDYLKDLGVDILWLSPIYDSPNDDNGYDIRDYHKIMKEFGTMDDFDELIEEIHQRDMRLIMDLVINHTSDEHSWFKEAKKGEENPYHDYYIWKNGKENQVPNNWTSLFEGSAWSYEQELDKHYLHLFSKKQVDLNWDNPKLRQELYGMVNWWLDKGVDGFRLDVINFISKEEGLPDGNTGLGKMTGITGIEHYVYGPRVHAYLQELYQSTFANYDVMTVGECQGVGPLMGQYFTHEDRGELDMIFDFSHMVPPGKSKWDEYAYNLLDLKAALIYGQKTFNQGCWRTVFFENHDSPRFVERLQGSNDNYDRLSKLIAILQLTLLGTPFLYQGQEIGMRNPIFHKIEDYKDVESLNKYRELKEKDLNEEDILHTLQRGSRDNARIPISWNSKVNAGFSDVTPWIKVGDDFRERNVEKAMKEPQSIYHFYKQLIALRKQDPILVYGQFEEIKIKKKKDLFVYKRCIDEKERWIICNLSNKARKVPIHIEDKELLVTNVKEHVQGCLQPYEGCIYE